MGIPSSLSMHRYISLVILVYVPIYFPPKLPSPPKNPGSAYAGVSKYSIYCTNMYGHGVTSTLWYTSQMIIICKELTFIQNESLYFLYLVSMVSFTQK